MRLEKIPLAVDASGDQTAYSQVLDAGKGGYISALRYVPDGTSPLATGADLTITGETTTVAILTVTNLGTSAVDFAPRRPTVDNVNAASLYAAAGEPVEDRIAITHERIKVVVAQGGVSKLGTLWIWIATA